MERTFFLRFEYTVVYKDEKEREHFRELTWSGLTTEDLKKINLTELCKGIAKAESEKSYLVTERKCTIGNVEITDVLAFNTID